VNTIKGADTYLFGKQGVKRYVKHCKLSRLEPRRLQLRLMEFFVAQDNGSYGGGCGNAKI